MPEPASRLLELVETAVLESVSFLELAARRTPPVDQPSPPTIEMQFDFIPPGEEPSDNRRFQISMRVTYYAQEGEVVASPAAVYGVPSSREGLLTPETIVEYANEVAIMTLLPYARSGLSDLSVRVLDTHVLMPVFLRGELELELSGSDVSDDSPASE